MAWEYLESDHMDERFRVAVAELTRLGVDWPSAFVLDLNCGFSARLLKALPEVSMYFGNDIAIVPSEVFPGAQQHGACELLVIPDDAVRVYLGAKSPTVLCCFGFSTEDALLSSTLEQTYRGFLREAPFAVLEKPVRWLKPPWETVIAWPEWRAFDCVDIDVHFQAPEHLEWRRVRVAKRRT